MHPQVKEPAPTSLQTTSTPCAEAAVHENQSKSQASFVLWYGPRNSHGRIIRQTWRTLAPSESLLHFVSAKRVFPFLMDPATLLPRVIVLEANACGFKLLEMIRSASALAKLPVAMVARPGRFSDVGSAYGLGADWCFIAPQDGEQAKFFAEAAFAHFQRGPARLAAPAWAVRKDTKSPATKNSRCYSHWTHELQVRWDTLLAWGKSLRHS